MKQFFVLLSFVFAFSSVSAFSPPSIPTDLVDQIRNLLPTIFNFTDLDLPSPNDILSSISLGKCPETAELSESFKLEQFLGTWYEIQRTNVIFESGQRCVKAHYEIDSTGNVAVNNSGVNSHDKAVYNVGTAKTSDKSNVFSVKFFALSPSAQYWVVDTDYSNYALVVSCNEILGLFNINDAWILSRKSTLDDETVEKLKAELESFGLSSSRFIVTDQDC